MSSPESKLKDLGLALPEAAAPVANYVPYVISGNMVFISGQISKIGDEAIGGRLGEDLTVEQGQKAAKLSALNLIAQMKAACGGDLSRVARVVKLGGFVQALPTATQADIPKVINGCSDIMVAVFGEAGRHARFAVSAPSLPLDVAVEIDAVIEITLPQVGAVYSQ
ncbi:RidA family protein [Hellea balneolensis]|uniref:RidA family protein n=1 Tax=Hellea balneolensis TaxID=287478 RepID=UPI000404B4CF|nr:RidA family protein [Hellea balneolensis]